MGIALQAWHICTLLQWELTLVPSVLIGAGLVSYRMPLLIRGSLVYIEIKII